VGDDDETTNFIENFRDGKRHMMEMESLQIIRSGTSTSYDNDGMFESPKKTSSSEGANLRRVLLPQKQGQQHVGTMVDRKHGNVNDTEEEEYENDEYEDDIDGDTASSINNSELTVGKKKTWSTTLLSTSGGEGVGSDSERFRDDLRSSSRGSGHSGSDVNVVNRGLINGGGGGGGGTNNGKNKKSFGLGNNLVVVGSPPLPLPSKSILTSHYSSSSTVSDKFGRGNDKVVGNKSMNFRDGNTRLATYYKDEAFSSRLVGDDNSNAIFKDEEEEEEEKYKGGVEEENDIDGRYDQANTGPNTRTSTASGSSSSSSSSSKLLLSIDPRSIDIIPLSKGRAVEGSETSKVAAAASTTTDAVDRSNIIPDPFSSEMLFHPHGESGAFVKMFRGSASYIANHRKTTAVYHIPGELLSWEGFPGLMDDIALTWLLGMKIVLVAGCRHQIDLRLDKKYNDEEMNGMGGMLNKEGEMNNGDISITNNKQDMTLEQQLEQGFGGHVMMSSIRVTDDETLRVVKEEAGYVRFEIERRLAKSLRLHGGLVKGSESLVGNVVSGNFYSAQPFGVVDGLDYCWTGFPRKVEIERIKQVHETNDIVLLTSLGVSPSGEIFNVNSEFLSAVVAGAMSASKIVYFNVHGTSFQHRHTKKPVQNLRVSDAKNLLAHYKMRIHPKGFALVDLDERDTAQQMVLRTPGSMETLIKLGYSMVALEKGVKRAHILAPENGALVQELYTRDGCGTLISRDIYEGIRRADVNDVSGIYDLIDPLVRMGTLVERPKSTLEKEILSYYVFTRDGLILATGQLKRYEGGFAEIGCLVVSSEYRRGGRGDAMLGYLERLSLQCGATKVFVLSTQTMEWFVERGFIEVPVEVSENYSSIQQCDGGICLCWYIFFADLVISLTPFF
jgi:amino-acid N-acetyltransferase